MGKTQPFYTFNHRGLLRFFLSLDYSKKPQGRNFKCQIFIQHFFTIVLHWCLDMIYHDVGTLLKYNKYIFDIPIPFCHNLYLSATVKQFLTEFGRTETVDHSVYMREHTKIHVRFVSVRENSDYTCRCINIFFSGQLTFLNEKN